MTDEVRSDVVEKVQSLLAKSVLRGASVAEAEGALRVAQRLMLKHNITMQEVQDHQGSDSAWWLERTVWRGKTRTWEQPYVISICCEFFFVRGVWNSRSDKWSRDTRLLFFGVEDNVLMAKAVFLYLCKTFRQMWTAYRTEHGLDHSRSRAYYAGLAAGLEKKLRAMREQDILAIETDVPHAGLEGGGLIRISTDLEQAFETVYKGIKKADKPAPIHGERAYRRGMIDGQTIEIDIEPEEKRRGDLAEEETKCLS